MSVENQNAVTGESVVLERPQTGGVYASLFEKINLSPVSELSALDMPMDDAAQYVAVAAMFLAPDQANDTWRVVLTREDLDPDKPRIIDAGDNRLVLKPVEGN